MTARRRDARRLAEVFGDVFPDATADERDSDERDADADRARDDWYRANRPPHHERQQ